jgi:tetratricopeptide (TPR) repeat protein
MDEYPFGPEQVLMLSHGRADEVEQRLLNYYVSAKASADPERLRTAITCLAHFYGLPFKQDLQKAEHYLQEGLRTLPDAESALRLVYFCYLTLSDPRRTLEAVACLRALKPEDAFEDLQFLYTAIGVEGLAHLALGEEQDAINNLEELLDLATRKPPRVVFGDELSFLEQMATRGLAGRTGKSLFEIARAHACREEFMERDEKFRERYDELARSQGWDANDGGV